MTESLRLLPCFCDQAAHPAILCLDGEWSRIAERPTSIPPRSATSDNLAYCIYTSGSTGSPKGVAVTHRAIVNHERWLIDYLGLSPGDRILQHASINFDASIFEYWSPLLAGARCVLSRTSARDNALHLLEDIAEHKITFFQSVPSLAAVLLEGDEKNVLSLLRGLYLGGEALPRGLRDRILARYPARLYNSYGPTEAAVDASASCCERAADDVVSIGRPIRNTQLYVLGPDMDCVPVGVVGELYIGGRELARGYLNRAGLTAQSFVPNPYATEPGERLYKTGDLVRWLAHGEIEYIGRCDHQIKIRGHRIELGEIEAILAADENARAAVVSASSAHGTTRLVAYVVPRHGPASNDDFIDRLMAHLAARLPDYMRPSSVVLIDEIPLTPAGKVNRKALPAPEVTPPRPALPQDDVEQILSAVWRDVLRTNEVGVTDNFFTLGGDSILSLQIVVRARKAGLLVTPKQIFEKQTIRDLAPVAQRLAATSVVAAEPEISESTGLTAIQQRFFEEMIPHRDRWNQSVLLDVHDLLNVRALETALAAVVSHHDALRLRFTQSEPGVWAMIDAADNRNLPLLWTANIDDVGEVEAIDRAHESLSLQRGPLVRALYLRERAGTGRLLLVIHHLVVDGVSWRILLDDLHAAYRQALQNAPIRLPPKTTSFRTWARHLFRLAESGDIVAEHAYWQAQLSGGGVANLPRDRATEVGFVGDSSDIRLVLDRDVTDALLRRAPGAYRTQINDLLLTALARALCRWSGSPSVLIELEGHGREALFDNVDISRTVGWFTTAFPVRLTPDSDILIADDIHASISRSIKCVKEQLRSIPRRGIGYGLLAYGPDRHVRNELASGCKPRFTFNYLGQLDGSKDTSIFSLSSHDSGRGRSLDAPLSNWITANGFIRDGKLRFSLSYSRSMYNDETIRRVAEMFDAEIRLVVSHCIDAANGGLTPADVPLAGLSQAQLDALPINPREVEDIYRLTPMQQGMLYHCLHAPDAGYYINQLRVPVEGLDTARLRSTWSFLTSRHAVLRSCVISSGDAGHPVQIIRKDSPATIEEIDWTDRTVSESDLSALCESERAIGFDLSVGPLSRIKLVRLPEPNRAYLVWTHHHLLMDGWSSARLMEEALDHYGGAATGSPTARYRDYIVWLQGRDSDVSEIFWRSRLKAMAEPTFLAAVHGQPIDPNRLGDHDNIDVLIDHALAERVRCFCQHERVTLNTLVQGLWAMLLSRFCGQPTVAFGVTVSGRPTDLPGSEEIVGLLINTLPVICTYRPEQLVGDWLRDLQTENLALRDHEHVPLHHIQRWAGRPGQAIFDTIVVFENYPVDAVLRSRRDSTVVFGQPNSTDITNYPLVLTVQPGEQLRISFSYANAAFSRPQVDVLTQRFLQMLAEMVEAGARAIGTLAILLPGEGERLLATRCCGISHSTDSRCLHTLIEARAREQPSATAVVDGSGSITYRDLNARANRLARYLRINGVRRDTLVGVAVERSIDLVVALLAILKAGGAYVPLDPSYPADRLSFMIGDAGLSLILTEERLRPWMESVTTASSQSDGGKTPPASAALWCIDRDWRHVAGNPEGNLDCIGGGHDLAYCIYTSGSTGRPKGAANTHRAIVNRLAWMGDYYDVGPADKILHKTPFSFDVSVWELFLPLVFGAGLVVAPPGSHRDPNQLARLIDERGITMIHFVPSMLNAFLAFSDLSYLSSLRAVICSGEALSQDTERRFRRRFGIPLYNLYGPTEVAVDVSFWLCGEEGEASTIPIGRPIWNTQLYVLDGSLDLTPEGVIGEIYIGGVGLARGYHRRAALTAERFVPNPFGQSSGERLYRTGDLGRWRRDGALEYLGRCDHQVKIHGLRIELGEIETRLLEDSDIREAAVVVRDDSAGPHLVGYVVVNVTAPDGGDESWELVLARLKTDLRTKLPEYMIPRHILRLDSLPLSPNGKLDRQALPAIDLGTKDYVAPSNDIERRLVGIWQDLLKLDQVGVTDNFFELGGDSILAMMLVARAGQAGIEGMTTGVILTHQSIRELAAATSQKSIGAAAVLRRIGDRPPVLCLHPFQGRVDSYVPVTRQVLARHPVIGFEARWLRDPLFLEQSVESVVSEYAEYVRSQVDTTAGCFVIGWSWGGLLAYELAAQLDASRIHVHFVGAVDVYDLSTQVDSYVAKRSHLGEQDASEKFLEHISASQFRLLWVSLLEGLSEYERSVLLLYYAETRAHWTATGTDDTWSSHEYRTIVLFNRIHITRRYILKPSTLTIKPRSAADSEGASGAIDWTRYSSATLPTTVIKNASHSTVIRSPDFFESLRLEIDEALSAASGGVRAGP